MADNYYSNPDSGPESDTGMDESEPMEEGGEDEATGGKTALLPKSVLGGKDFKPGEEVVLKVTHVYDDEVAVEYASDDQYEDEGEGEEPPPPPPPPRRKRRRMGMRKLAGDEEFDMAERS